MATIKRRRLMLTPNDFKGLDVIARKHALPSRTQAIRYAVSRQEVRDARPGRILPADRERIKASTSNYASKSQLYGPDELRLIGWSTPLTDDDFAAVLRVKQHWGLKAWSEAVRLAIRFQAEADGFRPLGGIW